MVIDEEILEILTREAERGGLKEAEIELSNGGKLNIVHNLKESFGVSLEGAFDNWLARVQDENWTESWFQELSEECLCRYINSKNVGLIAVPREVFDQYFEEQ